MIEQIALTLRVGELDHRLRRDSLSASEAKSRGCRGGNRRGPDPIARPAAYTE